MAKYIEKQRTVDAYQLKQPMEIDGGGVILYGQPGDWLVFNEDGIGLFMRDEDFKNQYNKIVEQKVAPTIEPFPAWPYQGPIYDHKWTQPRIISCGGVTTLTSLDDKS